MAITADAVKELRERTGAGMMDCKRALEETDGDLDKAVALLRERGVASAAKKAGRDAREGVVGTLHPHGRPHRRPHRGQLRDGLRRADRRVPEARQATSRCRSRRSHPQYSTIDAIPADVLEAKQEALLADQSVQAKPEAVRGKIVEGQLKKWYQQVVLTEQPFRDTELTVGELITQSIATIGENIRVRRFARFEIGEEL